jgi:trehalose-phosphatase
LARRLKAGTSLLLLSDFDGTLAPINENPEAAWLTRDVHSTLALLSGSGSAHVGILSGRSLDDLRARIGLSDIFYAGCQGLEVEGPGIRFRHAGADALRPILANVAADLAARMATIPGVRIESKGLAVAVHYRLAGPGSRRQIEAALEILVPADMLTVVPGRKVFEILPRVGWHKGQAALMIANHLRARTGAVNTIVYCGDDATDELAFEVLGGRAITIRVGLSARRTLARYRLPHPLAVHQFVSALLTLVREAAGRPVVPDRV